MASSAPNDPNAAELDALRRPLRGRRLLSWTLLLLALAGLALAPWWLSNRAAERQAAVVADAAPRMTAVSAEEIEAHRTRHAWDRVWDAGPLDAAHSALSLDCRACHSEPFARVRDEDCTACHLTVTAHAGASPPIAGDPAPRCASCHREHNGPQGLALQNIAQSGPACVECHEALAARKPELGLLDVRDFGDAHPEFAIRVAGEDGALRKLRLGSEPAIEPTGLKFPHDVHLAAGIDGPDGPQTLSCGSCHRATEDALGFEPVAFETDCESCHALTLETTLARRSVPHGSVDDALSMIREFYSFAASNTDPRRAEAAPSAVQRPGAEDAVDARFVGRPGDALTLARIEATDLFEKRACAVCHTVTRVAENGPPGSPAADLPLYRIAAVAPVHDWMPSARFSHAAHAQSECSTCHAAEVSNEASEVLMPMIGGCRDCHAGAVAAPTQVRSDCGLCHDYHPAHAALQEAEVLAGRLVPTAEAQ
jgi:predicted CXXCH cytochrome family protein